MAYSLTGKKSGAISFLPATGTITQERWISQTAALLDKREMVEIRHELIQRRQVLRKQMDYNQEVAESARNEVKDIAATYPKYAQEILAMVERYDR